MYSVIIVAAGSGSRMKLGYNKMFYKYEGKTLFEHSLLNFLDNKEFNEIVLVISPNDELKVKEILNNMNVQSRVKLAFGGSQRQESVLNGLEYVTNDMVFIHDGARIFLSSELIVRLITKAKNLDAEIAGYALAVKSIDTTLLVEENEIKEKLDREKLYLMQTPQVSRVELLKTLLLKAKAEDEIFTDEMSLFLANKKKVHIVESEYYNKKITTQEDIK